MPQGTYLVSKSLKVNQTALNAALQAYTTQCLTSQQETWVENYLVNNPPNYDLCNQTTSDLTPAQNQSFICGNTYKLILEDMSPGGKWATYEINPTTGQAFSDDPYSLLNPNNILHQLTGVTTPISFQNITFPNGQTYNNLNSLINDWDWTSSTWAEKMLKPTPTTTTRNHPEYCIYAFQCEAPTVAGGYGILSFANLLETTESFQEAVNLNLIDANGNLLILPSTCGGTPMLDPLFAPSTTTPGTLITAAQVAQFKTDVFKQYQNQAAPNNSLYYNIYDVALNAAFCDAAGNCNIPSITSTGNCAYTSATTLTFPNLSVGNGCNNDMYWNTLRNLYLAKRKGFIENYIQNNLRVYPQVPSPTQTACTRCFIPDANNTCSSYSRTWPDGTVITGQYSNPLLYEKSRLFPDANVMFSNLFPNLITGGMNGNVFSSSFANNWTSTTPPSSTSNVATQCSTTCASYRPYWQTQLNTLFVDKGCTAPSGAVMTNILNNMESLCACGCDANHPMGSSNLTGAPTCTTTSYTSFLAIINALVPSCTLTQLELDAYIGNPGSYQQGNIALITPMLDKCACDKILNLYVPSGLTEEQAFFNQHNVHLSNISDLKCKCNENFEDPSGITAWSPNATWSQNAIDDLANLNIPIPNGINCTASGSCILVDELDPIFEAALTTVTGGTMPTTELQKNMVAAAINQSLGNGFHYDFAFYRDIYDLHDYDASICSVLSTVTVPCSIIVNNQANANAQMAFQQYVQQQQTVFASTYLQQAFALIQNETYTMDYTPTGKQYTLYYYDRAGNLLKTVPPGGVALPTGSATQINAYNVNVNAQRDTRDATGFPSGTNVFPAHTQVTQYRYNSLNQMYASRTPDVGSSTYPVTRYWYDYQGRIVASQNPRQVGTSPNRYSYIKYDNLGRTIESGQVAMATTVLPTSTIGFLLTQAQFNTFKTTVDNSPKSEVSKTYYDDYVYDLATINPNFGNYQVIAPNYQTLRNRIASVTYEDITDASYENAIHYEYDIHGNVKRMVTDNPELSDFGINERYKTTEYDYDLLSDKVTEVRYQPNLKDQLTHRYNYDADNRIVSVFTSRDGIHFDRDAAYEYYRHGVLARTELGENRVQGLDYAYTIQGWIKGVNSAFINPERDMGKDGSTAGGGAWSYYVSNTSINRYVARDAFAYQLHYFNGDYSPVVSTSPYYTATRRMDMTNTYSSALVPVSMYNGNIAAMTTSLRNTAITSSTPANNFTPLDLQLKTFRYDQLNRITKMRTLNEANPNLYIQGNTANTWTASLTNAYKEDYTYDANGNIRTLNRNSADAALNYDMDKMTYVYSAAYPNRLLQVTDLVAITNSTVDIDNQTYVNNYTYDLLGNLIADSAGKISSVQWDNRGKIRSVSFSNNRSLEFRYDAMGNRIAKKFIANATASPTYTYYVRDAQGNTMATYNRKTEDMGTWTPPNGENYNGHGNTVTGVQTLALSSLYLYGSSRLGEIASANLPWEETHSVNLINTSSSITQTSSSFLLVSPLSVHRAHIRNARYYELSNHLGNVLATITDAKIAVFTGASPNLVLSYYLPTMHSNSDYYAFGMEMPGRNSAAGGYRYGFNGKENDNEMYGEGNALDFGARMYDSRVGRWLSVDPRTDAMSGWSPYSYCFNSPIMFVDQDGELPILPLLFKAGANAAADWFMQTAMNYYFNPATSGNWSASAQDVSGWQIARSGLEGLIPWKTPGGRLGKAALSASGDVMVEWLNNGSNYSTEQAVQDFAVGFIGDLAGGGLGELISKYGSKAVRGGMRKLGFDCETIRKLVPSLCFVKGTLILTNNGLVSIENVAIGDSVWAYSDSLHILTKKVVYQTYISETHKLVKILIGNTYILCTPDHPFYVQNNWIKAINLKTGDLVSTYNNTYEPISQIYSLDTTCNVYNFAVQDFHTYFVSNKLILTHNRCGDGWIAKDMYSKLSKKNSELTKVFEDAMAKGVARSENEAGIKALKGKGKKVNGVWYEYELKTAPGSKYGNHRLYGNTEEWVSPKGVKEERVIFREYDSNAH